MNDIPARKEDKKITTESNILVFILLNNSIRPKHAHAEQDCQTEISRHRQNRSPPWDAGAVLHKQRQLDRYRKQNHLDNIVKNDYTAEHIAHFARYTEFVHDDEGCCRGGRYADTPDYKSRDRFEVQHEKRRRYKHPRDERLDTAYDNRVFPRLLDLVETKFVADPENDDAQKKECKEM